MRNIIDVDVYATKAATSISKKKKRVQSEGEKKSRTSIIKRGKNVSTALGRAHERETI